MVDIWFDPEPPSPSRSRKEADTSEMRRVSTNLRRDRNSSDAKVIAISTIVVVVVNLVQTLVDGMIPGCS